MLNWCILGANSVLSYWLTRIQCGNWDECLKKRETGRKVTKKLKEEKLPKNSIDYKVLLDTFKIEENEKEEKEEEEEKEQE